MLLARRGVSASRPLHRAASIQRCQLALLPRTLSRHIVLYQNSRAASPQPLLLRCFSDSAQQQAQTQTQSNSEESISADKTPVEQWQDLYEGPFTKHIQRMRTFSFLSCCLTAFGTPFLYVFSPNHTVMGMAVTALVFSFGLFTTSMLHVFSSSYVASLAVSSQQRLRIAKITLLGRKRFIEFPLAQALPQPDAMKPLTTFVRVGTRERFFLHEEAASMHPVLASLVVQKRENLPLGKHARPHWINAAQSSAAAAAAADSASESDATNAATGSNSSEAEAQSVDDAASAEPNTDQPVDKSNASNPARSESSKQS